MNQALIAAKQGFTLMKQVAQQMAYLYGQVVHTMKTNVILRPMYKWWEGRFWLKEESCKFLVCWVKRYKKYISHVVLSIEYD